MTLFRLLALLLLAGLVAGAAFGAALPETVQYLFGEPRAEASDPERTIFANGRHQFSRIWDESDGVGDWFNEHSCLGCHSVPAPGGSGTTPNSFVVVSKEITRAGGGHTFQRFQRTMDGVTELPTPSGSVRRKPPMLFGLGLLDAVSLRQPVVPAPGPDRIVGRVGGTSSQPGRLGWKARIPNIRTFVATAFVEELGLGGKSGRNYKLAVAIEEITAFVTLLGPPPHTHELDESVMAGQRIFEAIGCSQCHKASLQLTREAATELRYRPEIRAYTDLLIHNMGPELADGIVEGRAGAADFRTAPLWGLSASGPPYLHDGRAPDLSHAVAMHDGEARNTRLRWDRLRPIDRDALNRFLETL